MGRGGGGGLVRCVGERGAGHGGVCSRANASSYLTTG